MSLPEFTRSRSSIVSRRSALAVTGAAAFGVAGLRSASAQASDLTNHPLTGTWMAMANPPLPDDTQFPAPSLFAADGTVLLLFPVTARGPQGPFSQTAYVGVWEPDGERRGHFTATQSLSAADGTFLGTVTVDGFPEVSEDGQSFIDDGSRVTVTIRDAAGAVVEQMLPTGQPDARPVTGVRMAVAAPGLSDTTAPASTPMSS